MKSKLYTRTGDEGTTALIGGRTDKDDIRLEAYGTIDELNSWLGLLAADPAIDPERRTLLLGIQNTLFDIGSILATAPGSTYVPAPLESEAVEALETAIDTIDTGLPPLNAFVLPGGTQAAARASIARTVARRAERHIITLNRTAPVDPVILRYINRLSDLLFAYSREINLNARHDEIFWQKKC